MAQWWERSPPTNVSRVRFPYPASYVGLVCCWFSSLLREVFLRVLRFSPSPQKPTFPNSNSIWNCQALYREPLARVIAQALPVFDIKFAFTGYRHMRAKWCFYLISKRFWPLLLQKIKKKLCCEKKKIGRFSKPRRQRHREGHQTRLHQRDNSCVRAL